MCYGCMRRGQKTPLECQFSPSHVGLGDLTQVISLGGRHLHPLSHLSCPVFIFDWCRHECRVGEFRCSWRPERALDLQKQQLQMTCIAKWLLRTERWSSSRALNCWTISPTPGADFLRLSREEIGAPATGLCCICC